MEALAPPQHGKQPRREGVTLNRIVGEHPLSHHDQPSSQQLRVRVLELHRGTERSCVVTST